jgi:hypothetical protein
MAQISRPDRSRAAHLHQSGDEDILDISEEQFAIDRSVEQAWDAEDTGSDVRTIYPPIHLGGTGQAVPISYFFKELDMATSAALPGPELQARAQLSVNYESSIPQRNNCAFSFV